MAKVSVLNVPAHGHINPTLAVVQELVRRGEQVTYFATEPFRDLIETTGAAFHPYHADAEKLLPAGAQMMRLQQAGAMSQPSDRYRMAIQMFRNHVAIAPEILDALRADRPEYLICGNVFSAGRIAAQVLNVPVIASVATLPQRSAEIQQVIGNAVEGQGEYQQLQTELKRTYNIEIPFRSYLLGWPEALNIVYTSRTFQANADQYDDHYKFVGPCLMRRPSPEPFPFEQLTDGPLIYISLGTIFNNRPDFYRLCLDAFGGAAYQVVMVLPRQISPAELGAIPGNFIVQPFVPQLDLFPRVSLFITHGGMSSVQEGLYFGVPLVVFPQMFEQAMTAQRVAELGAGLVLSNEGLTVPTLRTTAEHVITDPAFRQQCRKISDSLKAAGGTQRAVDEILAFVKH